MQTVCVNLSKFHIYDSNGKFVSCIESRVKHYLINMSCGATVNASAANSNLIKLKQDFYPCLE